MVRNVNGLTRGVFLLGLLTASLIGLPSHVSAGSDGLPDDRLGRRTAPLLLLSRDDVRQDLGLTQPQGTEVDKAIIEFYSRAWELKGKKGPAADAERKKIDQEQVTWINTHLTAKQRARLIQVDLWWEGPSALVSRPLVGENVGLSVDQRSALIAAVKTRDADRGQKSFSMAAEDALWSATKKTLSPAQIERYEAMLGQRFRPRIAMPVDMSKVKR